MKRQRIDIKKTIKKKIELRNQKYVFIQKRERTINKNMTPKRTSLNISHRNLSRAYDISKPISVELVSYKPKIVIQYQKKAFVDYDVIICIPSYDRYKKVKRLISQFYQQPTKYTFKIILLNDGSNSLWYDILTEKFPDILYFKNDVPNGKVLHWYCYNQMWEHIRNIQSHAVLQMDDDFILSDNFLNTMMDLFFNLKEKNGNMMAISPHLWSFKLNSDGESWWKRIDFVDGIALMDSDVIKYLDYKLKPVDIEAVSKAGAPVRAWTQISEGIKNMNGFIYRTQNSLVYHDGNNDSKLHGDVRKEGQKGVYTQKYIGNL